MLIRTGVTPIAAHEDRPVRPLMLLPFDPVGGRTGGIRTWAEGFVAKSPADFEIMVVAATGSPDLRLRRWTTLEIGGREVRYLPVMRILSDRRPRVPATVRFGFGLLRCRGMLPLRRSVLQIHRPASDFALLGARRPAVRIVHNTSADLTSTGSGSRWPLLPGILNRVEGLTIERVDIVYAVSERAADDYRRRYPAAASRIRAVTNWYDETLFAPAAADSRRRLRSELGLAEDDAAVLFVGRLEQQKDPLLLAETFASLVRTHPKARLLVVGDGVLRGALEERLALLGVGPLAQILTIVSHERVAEIMRAADVLCVTSAYETGPTVGLEALASGLPVVITGVGQVARIVEAESAAGRSVVERSADALASALAELLDTPFERRQSAAVRLAEPYAASRVLAPIYEDHRRLMP